MCVREYIIKTLKCDQDDGYLAMEECEDTAKVNMSNGFSLNDSCLLAWLACLACPNRTKCVAGNYRFAHIIPEFCIITFIYHFFWYCDGDADDKRS